MTLSIGKQIERQNQAAAAAEAEGRRLRAKVEAAETVALIRDGKLMKRYGFRAASKEFQIGWLLAMKEAAEDPKQRTKIEAAGQAQLDKEAADAGAIRELLRIKFPSAPPGPVRRMLHAAKFHFIESEQEWEGRGLIDWARQLAEPHNGTVRRMEKPAIVQAAD